MSYTVQFLVILGLAVLGCLKVTVQGFMSRQLVRNRQDSVWFNILMFFCMTVCFLIVFPVDVPDGPTLACALGAGLSVAVFQTCYAMALNCGPVSLTVLIGNFSVLITTAYGIIAFGDRLYASQMLAVVLLVASMVLSVNVDEDEKKKTPLRWLALVLLALAANAGSGCFQRTFAVSPNASYPLMENTFMVIMQLTAGVLSLAVYHLRAHTGKKEKSTLGFRPAVVAYAVAIAVILAVYQVFLLFGLANIEGTFFFPTYAGLQSLIMTLIGVALFRDKLSTRQKWGVVCGIACVVLMNVRAGFAI